MSSPRPSYDLRPAALDDVAHLFVRHHGYGGCSNTSTYCFAVIEDGAPVAAFAWQPPPPGSARSVCPERPAAVLALSRMVAVPRDQRRLRHISKPLRRQMRQLIDRSRWPVLVTYHDEGQGHTGHVYRCSGWTATVRNRRRAWVNDEEVRTSPYTAGRYSTAGLVEVEPTWLQRWEHWACPRSEVAPTMDAAGWHRVPTGGRWSNGKTAYTWTQAPRVHQASLFAAVQP